ncbi:MAG TPA: SRPBCC family protein [Polaromonas sp.]|uniref:SRPBCC family protein n=1 Tax=Polaromonas sp. TaxID=1869339 RepID=UPI002D672625|nr:SRPBCC family protein [Polaromonas sp.]HYW58271.1 SRPBCC family protein [Polaromonas sp.]
MKKHIANAIYSSLAATTLFIGPAQAGCADRMTLGTVPALSPQMDAKMVSHSVVFDVRIPASEFNARLAAAPLARLLPGTPKIAAVVDTRNLTQIPFGTPGGPRVVCLGDGSTAVEEAISNLPGKHFQYKVWNYTTEAAKPIEYGIGKFELQPVEANLTRVTWTYSFKLREDKFPGSFGGPGRWLFDATFMKRDYADMMAVSANAMSSYFR